MFAFSQVLRLRVLLVSGLIAVTSLSTAIAASNFTTIDVPAAGNAANQGTAVTAMDAAGDVAGTLNDLGAAWGERYPEATDKPDAFEWYRLGLIAPEEE